MAPENKSKSKSKSSNSNKNNKKRKNYLPHNKPVKKGAYPLRPGVEGFFITCDGGREYQASHEAINVIGSFYDELVEGTESKVVPAEVCQKPLNKITKFASSDSSESENDDDNDEDTVVDHTKDDNDELTGVDKGGDDNAAGGDGSDEPRLETKDNQEQEKNEKPENHDKKEAESVEPPAKRLCIEADSTNCENLSKKIVQKSVDKLIEDELAELRDKSKRRFSKLDTGCNGVVFIQMRKRDGDPSPKDIVHHMMTSLASTKKHISRFLLRVLPVEATCYTSDEEIRRAIKPVIEKYFPEETENPHKFAVLYDARANTGIDRAKVIDAVAKSVPPVHKVDLANPDISIVVQIVKTICLIGVVEKYKELAKYNLRQLSSPPQ